MIDTVKLLSDLIAIPSVNPAFLPANDPRAGEGRLSQFLADLGTRHGMDVDLQPVAPGRFNLLLRLCPEAPAQSVWLAPHMDTINATEAQFMPVVEGDKLTGRGACDTKGSVAAMFCAMSDLALSTSRPRKTEIVLTALVDEENAQLGSRTLAASGMKADLAIIGEPTLNRIITAHKGDFWIKLETTGKSAHGSRPELGKNAVAEMARIVEALETDYAKQLSKKKHPLLGSPTVSVGSISGGTQPNIVPDHCSCSVDRRTIPGETERCVRKEIANLLAGKKLRARFSLLRPEPCLPMETDARLPLVAAFLRLNDQTKPLGAHYFCDASILSCAGTPSIVFGPGNIAQAHTIDEWISVRSLEACRRSLVKFLSSLP